jgi:hypothetical protein
MLKSNRKKYTNIGQKFYLTKNIFKILKMYFNTNSNWLSYIVLYLIIL